MFYCCICQCDGSISGLAFHEQHPNSSLCPSAPPLNILYAHLRGSSTSYCLRGYYNDKSAHCAEKGGKEKVIFNSFFHLLSWIQMSYFAFFCIRHLPFALTIPTIDGRWSFEVVMATSWLAWRGKELGFCLIHMVSSHCCNTIIQIICQKCTQPLPNTTNLASQ